MSRAPRHLMSTLAIASLLMVVVAAVGAHFVLQEPTTYRDSDRALMWETERRESDGAYVSTHEAQEAAARVFEHVELKGLTRAKVVALIGDPKRSNKSINNFPFYARSEDDAGLSDALIYRIDTGSYGWQFNVIFGADGRVVNVDALAIE